MPRVCLGEVLVGPAVEFVAAFVAVGLDRRGACCLRGLGCLAGLDLGERELCAVDRGSGLVAQWDTVPLLGVGPFPRVRSRGVADVGDRLVHDLGAAIVVDVVWFVDPVGQVGLVGSVVVGVVEVG